MRCIKNIQWYPYRIPLRASFATAHGTLTAREGAIVEIVLDDNLAGVGDIAPMPEFAGDDLTAALAPLPLLASQLCGRALQDALDFLYNQTSELPATTLCGLESALLDALGKSRQLSISNFISVPHSMMPKKRVPVNVVIGALSLEDSVTRAKEAMRAGYRCLKLKVGKAQWEAEIARIAAVREVIGPDIHLRLDANEAWALAEAIEILAQCVPYTIQYVEQPLPAANLDDMRTLRYNIPIPIAADEAVYDLESARRMLAHEAAQILILKPQLAGGLRASQQILSEAAQHGVQCVITSTIESGIGVTGALHLAAMSPDVTLECGLATLHLLADDLLLTDLTLEAGFLIVPEGFGLGVCLDRDALARYTIDRKDYV